MPAGLGGAWKGRAGKSPSRRSRQSELRRRRQRPALEPPASPLCSPSPESQSQPLISSAFAASNPRGFPLGLTSRSCLHTQSNAFRLVPSTWAMAQSAGLKAERLARVVLVLLLGSVLLWTGEWGGAGRKLGGGGEGAVQPPQNPLLWLPLSWAQNHGFGLEPLPGSVLAPMVGAREGAGAKNPPGLLLLSLSFQELMGLKVSCQGNGGKGEGCLSNPGRSAGLCPAPHFYLSPQIILWGW